MANLSFQTIKDANALTPIMISQEKSFTLPASKSPSAVSHFLHQLNNIPLQGNKNALGNLAKTLHKQVKKKSLIILVGDFLGDLDVSLLAQRHELYLIIIRDSFEENPTALGDGAYTDPESGESANFYFGKTAKKAYAKAYHDNDEKLFKHLRALGVPYAKVVK